MDCYRIDACWKFEPHLLAEFLFIYPINEIPAPTPKDGSCY